MSTKLEQVNLLIAKALSTTFEEEARTCALMAVRLMKKHGLVVALSDVGPAPRSRQRGPVNASRGYSTMDDFLSDFFRAGGWREARGSQARAAQERWTRRDADHAAKKEAEAAKRANDFVRENKRAAKPKQEAEAVPIAVKFAAPCRGCGKEIPVGEEALWVKGRGICHQDAGCQKKFQESCGVSMGL